ncbi:sigma 54-interacting transcriptional regulator [Brevibacillus sp. TJ4]|uniref:sigma 54-interacting transcriptional regulator n=1 Tax=Brevibacillus sp. TJ4 TaxID=3234853 RepID=UPI003B9E145E
MNKDVIYEQLRQATHHHQLSSGDGNYEIFTSSYLADALGKKRNLVSHTLNSLVRDGKVVKVNTRPVYFFCKETLEQKWAISLYKSEFASMADLFACKQNISSSEADPFSKMIGYMNTISHQIEQCKVAVNYPPAGLPVLIHGATGVGKSLLAQHMYEYAVMEKVIDKHAPFVIVNCAEFANNPELLTGNLFGYVKGAFTGADENKTGFIEEADGGYLFLDEIHRLSPEGQEKLFLFMDKGMFRRLGETQRWRKSNVRFVFATTENPQDVLIQTFLRRIPIVVTIPCLEERSIHEKIELISHFFTEESRTIDLDLVVGKQVMNMLIHTKFEGNIGELRNIIKYTCANAYYKNLYKEGVQELPIRVSHLPDEFIQKSERLTENLLNKEIHFDDVKISRNLRKQGDVGLNRSKVLEELVLDVIGIYDNYRKDILDLDELIADVNKVIDRSFDTMIAEINADFTRYSVRFSYIKKVTDSIMEVIKNNFGLSFYSNTANVLANFLYYRSRNGYTGGREFAKKLSDLLQLVRKLYPKEHELAVKFMELIRSNLGIELSDEDIMITTLYIKGTNKHSDINRIRAIIISHGYSTASSIANVANRLLGQYVFEAIDMPYQMTLEEITKQLIDYIKDLNTSKGIIILVDMGALEDIHINLDGIVEGTIGIINNITTYLALDTGAKILQGLEVEQIVEMVTVDCQPKYKIIKNHAPKKKAILTTCVTGIGTAQKIKNLLDQSFDDYSAELKVIPYDFLQLKNNGNSDPIFKAYQVVAVIGTANPKIEHIPFVALEDIMLEQSNDIFSDIFRGVIGEEEIIRINRNIVKLFSLQSVINHVTILNPDKLMNYIEVVTDQMQLELGMVFSNSVKISLYVHICCLVERLVKNEPIHTYEDLATFEKCHNTFIQVVRRSFSVIENMYSVTIPVAEIGFIYDIITMKTEDLTV